MISSMLKFIDESPVCFHAVENLKNRLLSEGYEQLPQGKRELKRGGKYFLTRNGSTLIAFRIPEGELSGYMLSASHSDSPCFRLHDPAEMRGAYLRLNAERYGGMLNACWLDRPLSVAGRVLLRAEEGLRVRLVDLKREMALIPNVAIHLNRDANSGAKLDPASDLIALYGAAESEGSFLREIAEAADCAAEDIVTGDLFLYNPQKGIVWGPQGEFVSAPRLDDLACVYACTEGFLHSEESSAVPVLAVFDNEEIGSETKQGAAAPVLAETLERISAAFDLCHDAMLRNSFMLSCDNGHAKHPNHPELADRTKAPMLNGGVVIKHSPRYATDAVSGAVFSEICRRAGVPVQHYANRPDMPGGSTLGNIADTKLPVSTVDIGMAQLAMHSCFETMGSRDPESFFRAVRACYESSLSMTDNGIQIR